MICSAGAGAQKTKKKIGLPAHAGGVLGANLPLKDVPSSP